MCLCRRIVAKLTLYTSSSTASRSRDDRGSGRGSDLCHLNQISLKLPSKSCESQHRTIKIQFKKFKEVEKSIELLILFESFLLSQRIG
jgi:hypothetical protein